MKKYLGWIVIVVVIFGIFFWWKSSTTVPDGKYDQFAQCVAGKGMTMYGAYWCPHCKKEKANFGSSFQYVPYVECTQEVKLCKNSNINSYPTWIRQSSVGTSTATSTETRYTGELGLEKIAQITGCVLPE
jgi:thiol-disulfide isomerase/thioredoxin